MGPESWDRIIARSPVPSPFMRWAWHRAWADSAPQHELANAFAVVLRDAAGTVDAVIPLAVREVRFRRAPARALSWAITDLGAPDHLDIPLGPAHSLEAVIPLIEGLPWDLLRLDRVASQAPGLERLCRTLRERGLAVHRVATDPCPYLDLPSDWDEYLGSLSPSRRQTIRRKERTLRREHMVALTDHVPGSVDEGFRLLQTLHAQRWSGGGVLDDSRLSKLLRRFTSELVPHDEVWLTTLDVDGTPVAAWYGFAWKHTVYFYQSGRDPRWETASVGAVLMGMMIRRAIERGYRRFDFLRGREAYKLSWTSTEEPNYEVIAFRDGWRGNVLRGLNVLGRARERFMARSSRGRRLERESAGNLRNAVDA